MTPLFSVIIPVWNGEDCIGACLDAIAAQTYAADQFEVLVVDNGSTDATSDIVAKRQSVKLLHEPVASSYRARNRALAEARGTYCLFTDADCIADSHWIEAAAAAVKAHPETALLGGRIRLFSDSNNGSRGCTAYESLFSFDQRRAINGGHCVTANWLSPTALLRRLGGFNATLRSGGDMEMSERITAEGGILSYVPQMIVAHPIRDTFSAVSNKYLRTLGGRWALRKPGLARFVAALGGHLRAMQRRLVHVAKAPDLSLYDRLAICGILIRFIPLGCMEVCRLSLGGAPRRS